MLEKLTKTLFSVKSLVLAIAFVAAAVADAQQLAIYEGQGVLENNWQDWSWCSDNLTSTTYTLSGPNSIEVTYTGGWQGFSLESGNSLPAGYFSGLSFSINGGGTAGRTINCYLNYNQTESTASVNINPYIEGGQVPANGWKLVTIPISLFHLKPTDQINRLTLSEGTGSPQPSFWIDQLKWVQSNPPSSVAIKVNANEKAGLIGGAMFGVNTATWDYGLNTPVCENLVSNGGFKAFRFPGGSASDGYNWASPPQYSVTFDQFASAVKSYGGEDVITTNYGSGTAAEAAAWVKYANVTNHYGMKYWEVGNEVYGSWEYDLHSAPHDPVTYAQQYAQYYAAMKAVDPTILVGAVAAPGEDSYANYSGTEVVTNPVTGVKHSGWTPVMLATLKTLGVQPDFIIYHHYPQSGVDCDFTLLAGNSGFISDVDNLRTQLADYSGWAGASTKIFCTETNCDSGTEGKQTVSLVNGLYLADTFGSMLETSCEALFWWDLINGVTTAGDNGSWLYGWREYGDEGMFSPDFSLVYPMYYVEQLLSLFASSGDSAVYANSTYGLLTAYATKHSDGSVRLMVVNKHPTAQLATTVSLTGITPSSTATLYRFGITEDNEAKNKQHEGITTATLSKVTPTTSMTFPPYSVTVIVFKPAVKA